MVKAEKMGVAVSEIEAREALKLLVLPQSKELSEEELTGIAGGKIHS